MTAAFIVNPRAGGESGKGQALANALAGRPGLRCEMLDTFADLPNILKSYGKEGVGTLFISSGDGTVQATQTLLAENNWFEKLPRLALLPHGSTNMNAMSLGFRPRETERILEIATSESYLTRATDVKKRHTVRVANPRNNGPLHGMFIGAGAVYRGTRYCQSVIHQKGVRGEWATFATFSSVIGRYLVGMSDRDDEEKIVQPYSMVVEVDGEKMIDSDQLVFLASTLEKLILGAQPFWGPERSDLRVTTVDYPPPSVSANVLKIMYGMPNRNLPASCRSRPAHKIDISTNSSFVIDGEFFDPPTDEPLRLELGTQFSYLCG
ncbi:MAG: diacylglycerol/lipid kinase family protein [Hyphomicrobiales bacterium]